MANYYFRFKQFTVRQQHAAMKVGTDGILLGAWVDVSGAQRVLDIGTGTGLIALMLAQRSSASIDAVEVEEGAARQARENIAASPWPDRVTVHHTPVQEFQSDRSYDLIVSNPPFFEHAYAAGSEERATARHGRELRYADLCESASRLLSDSGGFAVILPADRADLFVETAATSGLHLRHKTLVHPKPGKAPKRALMGFRAEKGKLQTDDLTVETETRHVYTDEFQDLTRDFYLSM